MLDFSNGITETAYMTGVIYDQDPARNPDFQYVVAEDYGMIYDRIGSDRKPVFNHTGPTVTTHGPATFYQWWRNIYNVTIVFNNITIELDNSQSKDSRIFRFADTTYFPIDGEGWGNWLNTGHNFHFCFETHASFQYLGGEIFNFTGDDDVFVFINNQLVVDLGGVTYARTRTVFADQLGLTVGEYYRFDFFFCERHTSNSVITFDISLGLFCKWRDWCGVCEGDGQSCCFDCGDGDPCKIWKCDVNSGVCGYTPKCVSSDPCKIATCDNGVCSLVDNPCTQNNPCFNSQCVAGVGCVTTPKNCDDGKFCTIDTCSNGVCINTRSNSVCNDSNACTDDTCDDNLGCQNIQKNCADSNGCTQDLCNTATGCYNPPIASCVNCNGVTCITDNPCFPKECDPNTGQCIAVPYPCNDGNSCTNDTCVVVNGAASCNFAPVTCSSPDPCQPTKCSQGTCVAYNPCDDLDPCTIDTCVAVSGSAVCSHTADTCDDGMACTIDVCLTGVGCAWYPLVCPDTVCQVGVCSNTTGCGFVPRNCDNGTNDFCTSFDCDENVGCVAFDKVCSVKDPSCHTAKCDREQQKCVESRRDTLQCTIGVPEAALIGTGAIVGIVIAAVAVLVIGGFLGKKGYDWQLAQKAKVTGGVQTNPLFEEASAFHTNPAYKELEMK